MTLKASFSLSWADSARAGSGGALGAAPGVAERPHPPVGGTRVA